MQFNKLSLIFAPTPTPPHTHTHTHTTTQRKEPLLGIREHAMGSIIGFAYHGIFTISDSTFLVIDDYLKVTLRVAALADLQVSCIWTYDSIGVGEDGPTHLPVETDRGLRVIPQLGRHQAGRCRGDSRGVISPALTGRRAPTLIPLQAEPRADKRSRQKARGYLEGSLRGQA